MYIHPAIPDIIQFREQNRDSVTFRRGFVNPTPGEVMYRQFIVDNAPRFRSIPDLERGMKTAFTRDMVEDLKQNNFIMIKHDTTEGQYFQYDMNDVDAIKEIRKKINQAMRDSVAIGSDVVHYNPLPLMNHAAGANVVHHPLPPLEIPEENVVVVGNDIGNNIAVNPLEINNMEGIPLPPPENEMEYESNNMDENDWEFAIHDPNWDELFASDVEDLANERIDTTTMMMDTNFDIEMWNEILEDLAHMEA
ncbi:predicted protein [Chaetoceros tenuissimus]|uniref:Uncharacterized protein n=1 Tax=Chaetoceros tenuissimus TaxID=426638 RepID=A0AAD3DF82_9STRA|nr:predicted protein [Chaetoceros tenuissimus]